jgi:hypothetical protein
MKPLDTRLADQISRLSVQLPRRLHLLPAILLIVFFLSACAAPIPASTTETTGPTPPSTKTSAAAVSSPTKLLQTSEPAPTRPTPTPTFSPDQIRPSAIAGSWYPADPAELTRLIDGLLAAVEPTDGTPIALIVPHAGYVYSGPIAARGFKQLAGKDYEVAVIIASDHQRPLSNPISVWAEGGFETPLGVAPVDADLARALVDADARISFDPAAHADEHPIEIELPFLQRVCPHCSIVPVLMGNDDDETIAALADALLSVLPGQRAVVIASSDLSHYPPKQEAMLVDGATLAAIETGDPSTVRTTIATLSAAGIPNLATCACGEGPILATMRVAAGLGADIITILGYANSADSPYGNSDQVVGYGAVMFWRYRPPELTAAQQEALLQLARTTIKEYLETGQSSNYQTDDPVLARRSGVFVTLRKHSESSGAEERDLRGCIGHMWADTPLYKIVQEMAVSAATADPRFPPITAEELDQVSIEISILSPLRRITDTEQIEVGRHGLMIVRQGQRGVLLPQVPVENNWNREEFLENLCLKANLPPDCWTEHSTLYAFTAVVFEE